MTNTGVTTSKLALWRSAIAIAYADGKITNSERALLHDYMQGHAFSDEQVAIIDNDLANGVDINTVFDGITDKHDRAHLINFARVLVHIDGDFDDAEQKIMEYITAFHAEAINLHQVLLDCRREARAVYNKWLEERAELQREERERSHIVTRPFAYLIDTASNAWDDSNF